MKKYLIALAIFFAPLVAYATISQTIDLTAPYTWTGLQTINYASSTQISASTGFCINGDCRTGWPAGGTGLATTSPVTAGNLLEYSSSNGGSAFGVATSAATVSSPLTGAITIVGTGQTIGIQSATAGQAGAETQNEFNYVHSATTTFSAPLVYTGSTNAVTCATCLTAATTPWPWNVQTNYGTTTRATTTPEWFVTGMMASSTSYFVNASTTNLTIFATGQLQLNGIKSGLLSTDAEGQVVSTTTVGTNFLSNSPVTPGSYTNANITVDAKGLVTVAANGSAGAGGGWPFTPGLFTYGTSTQATTTPEWFQTAFYASSTVANPAVIDNLRMTNATSTTISTTNASTTNLWDSSLRGVLLSTDMNGLVSATSSVGANYINGTIATVNTNSPLGGGGALSSGTILTLTCTTCLTSASSLWPFTTATTFATSTSATTTPLWLQGNQYSLFASSTAVFVNASTTNMTIFSGGHLQLNGITNSILGTDQEGQVVASSTIGNNILAASGVSAAAYTNANITVNAQGIITTAANGSAGGSGAWPWTLGLSTYGTSTNATTTPTWFQTGLYASSSPSKPSVIDYLSVINSTTTNATTTTLGFVNLKNALLSTNNSGGVVATTTIGTNYLSASTISGVTLGGNLAAHTTNSTLSGTSYNGSAAVSDWGINLGNANTWTALQKISAAGTTTIANGLYANQIAAPYLQATSTTATSTFAGDVQIGTNGGALPNPYLLIGTSSPGYGRVPGTMIDARADLNTPALIVAFNPGAGNCAASGFLGAGNILALASDYTFFGFTNSGWVGTGCNVGNALERPESTIIDNPTGDINFEMGSTSPQVAFKWYTHYTNLSMSLMSDGQLLLGTTSQPSIGQSSPNIGQFTIGTSTAPQLMLSDNTAADTLWSIRSISNTLYFATSTAVATSGPAALSIDGSGSASLFVGTTTNAGATYGSIAFSGKMFGNGITNANTGDYICYNTLSGEWEQSGTACSLSAKRFKTNIQPYTLGLDAVNALQPVTFYFKPGVGQDTKKKQEGFIAEDVLSVDPMLVAYGTDGKISGLDYPKFVVMLTKATQELDTKVNNLTIGKVQRSVEENYQWLIILLLLGWVIRLEIKSWTHKRR